MTLFLFLIMMANIIFVFGLFFSVQIKHMGVLLPAFIFSGMIFGAAWIEFHQLPYEWWTRSCLGGVGLGCLSAGLYYFKLAQRRPDQNGNGWFLVFVALVAFAAMSLVWWAQWPLKLDDAGF
ncbi:MAG: hypothetical protein ACFCUX_00830 [Candidatus Methylacidiphilales bacterium]